MSLFSGLFKSSQVKDCETALKLLRPLFQETLFYDAIEKQAAALIAKNPESVQKKMLLDGQSAQVTVLFVIANIAFSECATGLNHIYRGVLSMDGHSYRQVFAIAQNKLLEIGAIDDDALSLARADMATAVKEAG